MVTWLMQSDKKLKRSSVFLKENVPEHYKHKSGIHAHFIRVVVVLVNETS